MASHKISHSEAAKMEQVIMESFAKTLHIILESRSPCSSSRHFSEQAQTSHSSSASSSSSVRPRDKWFNLALRECPGSLENLDLWRQCNLEMVVVDVILLQKQFECEIVNYSPKKDLSKNICWDSGQDEVYDYDKKEKIIERWIVQFESRKEVFPECRNKRISNTLQSCYKKLVILLRSLYATLRLLPANKILHEMNLSGDVRTFSLTHKVSSFVEPLTRKEEAEMQQFLFEPVDISSGRFCISVSFCSSISDLCSESSASLSPRFIPDYVGSPLAYPLKRFPSFPVSRCSPLHTLRRHSWSYDRFRASSPSISLRLSPTFSEPHSSVRPSIHQFPTVRLPASEAHKINTSFDEYSPCDSPSPGNPPSKFLLRSESAPVDIPLSQKHGPMLPGKDAFTLLSTDIMKGVPANSFTQNDYSNQISIPKSYGTSLSDDLDDVDFTCPFDAYEEVIIHGRRQGSSDAKWRAESGDAAVGALVNMLKKASPLQGSMSRRRVVGNQDSEQDTEEGTVSAVGPKTTADALEELRGYQEMGRALLLPARSPST